MTTIQPNTPKPDWTDSELQAAVRAELDCVSIERTDCMRAALSAIGACRQAPDEPSEEVWRAMRLAYSSANGDGHAILAIYKAAKLTLAAPGVGEKVVTSGPHREFDDIISKLFDEGSTAFKIVPVDLNATDKPTDPPKPTAPEPEQFDEVAVVRVTWKDGKQSLYFANHGYLPHEGREDGVAKFPKPATCKTCGQEIKK